MWIEIAAGHRDRIASRHREGAVGLRADGAGPADVIRIGRVLPRKYLARSAQDGWLFGGRRHGVQTRHGLQIWADLPVVMRPNEQASGGCCSSLVRGISMVDGSSRHLLPPPLLPPSPLGVTRDSQ